MRVLSVGAAGDSAGLVTRALSAAGVTVRGLVRSAARTEAALRNGAAEVAVADLLDDAALAEALEGIDAVFHIVPAFAPDEVRAGTTLVGAATAAGVRRIVFSSVYHPALDLSNHRDKLPTEQAIYDSGLEFTILQPAMFLSQLGGYLDDAQNRGVIGGPYSPQSKMAYVDYRDVARVAVRAFVDDDLVGGTFELASPGEWSRADIADELSRLLGRDVRATGAVPARMPSDTPPALATGLLRMFRHYDASGFRGGNAIVLERLLGAPATTLPDYLEELVTGRRVTAAPR